MEISQGMIDNYLLYITDGWIEDYGVPSPNKADYYDCIMSIKQEADVRNDTEALRLGLDYLLCHPEISLENHGIVYGWTDFEVRRVISFIREVIYPAGAPLNCKEIEDIKLIPMGEYDWWNSRRERGLHPDFLKSEK